MLLPNLRIRPLIKRPDFSFSAPFHSTFSAKFFMYIELPFITLEVELVSIWRLRYDRYTVTGTIVGTSSRTRTFHTNYRYARHLCTCHPSSLLVGSSPFLRAGASSISTVILTHISFCFRDMHIVLWQRLRKQSTIQFRLAKTADEVVNLWELDFSHWQTLLTVLPTKEETRGGSLQQIDGIHWHRLLQLTLH